MSKSLKYKPSDFKILSGDDTDDVRIAYVFESNDGKVMANFFFEPGNVKVRGLVGDHGCLQISYPLINPVGDPRPVPPPEMILKTIITRLEHGEYD